MQDRPSQEVPWAFSASLSECPEGDIILAFQNSLLKNVT